MDDAKQMKKARDIVARVQFDNWKFADQQMSKLLQGVKLQHGVSHYLTSDTRIICSIRARLRFDRALLNASLAQRRLRLSPDCELCNTPESVEHCLVACERYDNCRESCAKKLHAEGIDCNLGVLLGDYTGLTAGQTRSAVDITSQFLLAIEALRKL